uniref:C2H2-type domain-containing protein n=1 Tax=Rhabditophanes sp. KR3021 TaxID=114890 RepID=A0AC35TMV8_9BILA
MFILGGGDSKRLSSDLPSTRELPVPGSGQYDWAASRSRVFTTQTFPIIIMSQYAVNTPDSNNSVPNNWSQNSLGRHHLSVHTPVQVFPNSQAHLYNGSGSKISPPSSTTSSLHSPEAITIKEEVLQNNNLINVKDSMEGIEENDLEDSDNEEASYMDVDDIKPIASDLQSSQNQNILNNYLNGSFKNMDANQVLSSLHNSSVSDADASSLLLNLSQSLQESSDVSNKNNYLHITHTLNEQVTPNQLVDTLSVASKKDGVTEQAAITNVEVVGHTTNGSFIRPPGLGPMPLTEASSSGNSKGVELLQCSLCGFSCTSKFHYNSHMNTHGDHQCTMCDYTSRTEGRLRRHMRDSHTIEQQIAAGLDVDALQAVASLDNTAASTPTPNNGIFFDTNNCEGNFASSILSLVDAANKRNSEYNAGMEVTLDGPSALDQFRKFTDQTISNGFAMNLDQLLPSTSQLPNNLPNNQNSILDSSSFGAKELLRTGNGSNKDASAVVAPEPRRTGGKAKSYKCKQCNHVSTSKNETWAHAAIHIPEGKQLKCKMCEFVTEYKHHLEYHERNHVGSKPFTCSKCAYSCVNKSMLNSHMKSHTNHYHFKCNDCTYATKYCHSLKLHLRKYNHKRKCDGTGPDMDMDNMGDSPSSADLQRTFNDSFTSIADNALSAVSAALVNSTPSLTTSIASSFMLPSMLNGQNNNLLMNSQLDQMAHLLRLNGLNSMNTPAPPMEMIPGCKMCEYQPTSSEDSMKHGIQHLLANQQIHSQNQMSFSQIQTQPIGSLSVRVEGMEINERPTRYGSIGDEENMSRSPDAASASGESTISPPNSAKLSSEDTVDSANSSLVDGQGGRQRKAKGLKLDEISQRLQGKSPSEGDGSGDEECYREMKNQQTAVLHHPIPQLPPLSMQSQNMSREPLNISPQELLARLTSLQENTTTAIPEQYNYACVHCKMAFADPALYHIHRGYHGYENPFNCNRCGYSCNDSLSFNMHLLQGKHD